MWVLIGTFEVKSRYTDTGELRGSIWLTLGILCFALYFTLITSYMTLDSDEGRIFMIKDSSYDEIREAIEARQSHQLLRMK